MSVRILTTIGAVLRQIATSGDKATKTSGALTRQLTGLGVTPIAGALLYDGTGFCDGTYVYDGLRWPDVAVPGSLSRGG